MSLKKSVQRGGGKTHGGRGELQCVHLSGELRYHGSVLHSARVRSHHLQHAMVLQQTAHSYTMF